MEDQPGFTHLARRFLLALAIVLGLALTPGAARWQPTVPVQAAPLLSGADLPMQAVSAGGHYTCALRSDGNLVCWGYNGQGQINVTALPAGLKYTQVSAGYTYTCGLHSDGTIACWGYNGPDPSTVPTLGAGLSYTQVSAGGQHACAKRSDGNIVCWGNDTNGQRTVPDPPAGLN